jgi:hypothetical protein
VAAHAGFLAATSRALHRCVDDPAYFMARAWGTQPLLRTARDAQLFKDLLTHSDVEELLWFRGLRYPQLKVVVDGRKIESRLFTKSGTIGSIRSRDLIDADRVLGYFANGATIVLSSVHRYWPAVGRFCSDLESALSHPVQANAYISPGGSQGLDLHWDTHDVFVLHTHGRKRWRVYDEQFVAPLRHQHRHRAAIEVEEPRIDTVLCPGDALYIPRGVVHAAIAEGGTSVHLTVGILNITWASVLEPLLNELAADEGLRQSLPPGFAQSPIEDLVTALIPRIESFSKRVAGADPRLLAERALSNPRRRGTGTPTDGLDALDKLASLGDETTIVTASAPPAVSIENGCVIVAGTDRVLRLPGRVAGAVDKLVGGSVVRVGDLGEYLDRAGRHVLVSRFIREGIVRLAPDERSNTERPPPGS